MVIRGRFLPATKNEKETLLPPTNEKLSLVDRSGNKIDVPLPKVYGLQHYIEIQLVSSRNGSAMTFGPAIIYLAQSMDGAKSGDRSLSIAVKFERPGHDPIGSVVLIGNRKVGDMTAYDVDESRRMRYEAPWFGTIASAEGTTGAIAADGTNTVTDSAGPAPVQPGGGAPAPAPAKPAPVKTATVTNKPVTPNGPTPYTITATVIETRPTKEFLAFVANVFSAVEPKLNDTLKAQIDPATRTANAGAEIDLQSAYASTYSTAQTAMYAYCALLGTTTKSDLIGKSSAARVAQLAANKAAINADLTTPYDELVEVGTTDPQTVGACRPYH